VLTIPGPTIIVVVWQGLFVTDDGSLEKSHVHVHWLREAREAQEAREAEGGGAAESGLFALQFEVSRRTPTAQLLCELQMEQEVRPGCDRTSPSLVSPLFLAHHPWSSRSLSACSLLFIAHHPWSPIIIWQGYDERGVPLYRLAHHERQRVGRLAQLAAAAAEEEEAREREARIAADVERRGKKIVAVGEDVQVEGGRQRRARVAA
jgi:hypothetical protein